MPRLEPEAMNMDQLNEHVSEQADATHAHLRAMIMLGGWTIETQKHVLNMMIGGEHTKRVYQETIKGLIKLDDVNACADMVAEFESLVLNPG